MLIKFSFQFYYHAYGADCPFVLTLRLVMRLFYLRMLIRKPYWMKSIVERYVRSTIASSVRTNQNTWIEGVTDCLD